MVPSSLLAMHPVAFSLVLKFAAPQEERAGLEESGILTCDKSIPSEILPSSLGKEHIRLIEKKNAAPSVGKGEIRL
jgi:hypothetical protein